MSYGTFCRRYNQWRIRQQLSLRQVYKGGEKLFVDYCGLTVPVVHLATGEVTFAQVFVACWGASNYTDAEAMPTQELAHWLGAHQRALTKGTSETHYYLSSLTAEAHTFARYIRAHEGIENQLHWCLAVVFKEDASRIRKDHAPRNMSLLRRLALNLLRQDSSKGSLAMKRYRAGLDNQFVVQILAPHLSHSQAQSDP